MPCKIRLLTLLGVALAAAVCTSNAQTFSIIDAKPVSELWLNPGAYSYHFQKNKGLNSQNFGLGGEYRYSTTSSWMLGVFENSDRYTSHYAVWHWQPLGLGPVRFGAVIGVIDGYPNMLHGGWFPALIPTLGIEYQRIGVNLLLIPGYQNRLYGAISVQLKLRVL